MEAIKRIARKTTISERGRWDMRKYLTQSMLAKSISRFGDAARTQAELEYL
jgi:phosphate uptake regulator